MTAAEKVLQWMKKYYEVNGTPNYGEIIAQLEMAIEEEKQGKNTDNAYKKCAECGKMKMVGVQCKDPRTGQCDKDTRYIITD